MEKVIRAAIIGCGGIANGKHMPAVKEVNDVEMVAFCDLIEEKAIEAKKKFGTPDAKVYTDYKELLKDTSIDTIHVCTPNRSHSYITIDALNAGKHVICEKPMAKTSKEAREMIEVAKKTGKLLTIGYQNRYTQENCNLKEFCEAGDLGEIYFAKAHAIRRRAVPTWGVFLNEYEQGGGPLIDIGTHALDLTLWCMDNYKPKMVVGTTYKKLGDQKQSGNEWGEWDPKEFTVEDSAFGFVVMENGATVILESSWALNILEIGEAKTTLCGTKAGADTKDGLCFNSVRHGIKFEDKAQFGGAGVAFFGGTGGKPEVVEANIFYNAVKNGTDLCVLPEQAFAVTQILEAIYESAKTGKPVFFD